MGKFPIALNQEAPILALSSNTARFAALQGGVP